MTKRSIDAKQDSAGCSEHGGVAVNLINHCDRTNDLRSVQRRLGRHSRRC